MTCAQNGIMVGTGEDTFSPNATLTDAETLMLGYRLYDQTNGGDGSLLKMPEDYGYIRIISDDGSFVHEGYAGDRSLWEVPNIHYSAEGYRLCLRGYGEYTGGASGEATLTFCFLEMRTTGAALPTCWERLPIYPKSSTFRQFRMEATTISTSCMRPGSSAGWIPTAPLIPPRL